MDRNHPTSIFLSTDRTLFVFSPAAANALGDEILRVYAFTPPVFSCHFPSFSQAWLMTNPTSLNKFFAIHSTHILGTFHVKLEGTQKIQKKRTFIHANRTVKQFRQKKKP